jgi:type I restriction enzyme, S subunit
MTELTTIAELAARGDLAFSDGYRTRGDQLGLSGIPILRVADVLDGRIEPSYKDFIRDDFRPKMGSKISEAGDVVITSKGTVGRIARIPDTFPQHVYSPQLCFLRSLHSEVIDPTWLFHWARSKEFRDQLGLYKDQTDMAPYVSLTDLRRVRVSLPPTRKQKAVADLIAPLDAIIEHSRAEIGLAEELAAALFQRHAAITDGCRS